ncbi:MAG: UPF0164 family protein [Endomicrobia bacterium]|nr:UPF0164 family protein [Endomicrobiia bacterium]
MKKLYIIKVVSAQILFLLLQIVDTKEYSLGFLKLPTSARQAAIQAYCGLSDDTAGIFYNPAGVTNIIAPFLGFTHTEHFQNTKYEFIGYIHPLKNTRLFFGITSLYAENIEGRSGQQEEQMEYLSYVTKPEFYYNVYDLQISIGAAKILYSNISVGTGVKFLSEKIYDTSGYTFAVDFGIQYYPEKLASMYINGLTLSMCVNNLGLPIRFRQNFYPLPSIIKFGTSYRQTISGVGTIFAVDYVIPVFDPSYVLLGIEILPNEFFSLRTGYKLNFQKTYLEDENLPGLSFGMGLEYFGVKLDYALVSYGILGITHKISLSLEVEKIGKFYKLLRERLFKRQ